MKASYVPSSSTFTRASVAREAESSPRARRAHFCASNSRRRARDVSVYSDTREEMLDLDSQIRSHFPVTAHMAEVCVNKAELVDKIADGASLSKKDAEAALNETIEAIKEAVARGDKVVLPGFGSFSRTERKERTGRNPRTGEPL